MMRAGAWRASSPWFAGDSEPDHVQALVAFLLLIAMLVLGARVRGVRDSFWKLLAFIAACIIVLALLLTILSK